MRHTINLNFIFSGTVTVEADDRQEAEQIATRDFGVTIGELHTSNDEEVLDWNFSVHPDKLLDSEKEAQQEAKRYARDAALKAAAHRLTLKHETPDSVFNWLQQELERIETQHIEALSIDE